MNIGQVGIVSLSDDAAAVGGVYALGAAQDNIAPHGQILDDGMIGRALAVYIAEEALIGGRGRGVCLVIDVQVIDRVALSIEGAGKVCAVGFVGADRRPVVASQINVLGQHGGNAALAAVDRLGKPCQLGAGGDLIDAVVVGLGFGRGSTVPCALGGLGQGSVLYQLAVHQIGSVGRAQLEGAVITDVAVLRGAVGIGAVAQGVGAVLVGGNDVAVLVTQGDDSVVDGLAVVIGDIQLHVVVDLAGHGDHRVGIVADVIADHDGVEVGAYAGVGHAVDGGEGIGGGKHGAEGIAVGQGVRGSGCALFKGQIRRDRNTEGSLSHCQILIQRRIDLRVAGIVGGLEIGGVEDTGDLIHAAVHAVKGQRHLVAGHDILAGVGGVRRSDGDLGHAHQTVADAGGVGHLEDNGAALAVADGVEAGQRHGVIAVSIGGNGLEIGNGGLHAVVGGSQRVFHGDAAGGIDGEVQRGVRLVGLIEPGVVVIIPIHGTGGGLAALHVEVHVRVGGAVGHAGAAHHHNAYALRIGGREQAAVAADSSAAVSG